MRDFLDGHGGDRSDVQCPHGDASRFGPQPRSAAGTAQSRALVLAQEDADVLLVPLPLLGGEKVHHPAKRFASVEHGSAEAFGQALPRDMDRDALVGGEAAQVGAFASVAGLGPGVDRPVVERPFVVGDDQRRVIFQGRAESGAGGAAAVGVVEGEEARRRCQKFLFGVPGAAEPLRKADRFADRSRGEHDGFALAFAEAGGDRVREPVLPALSQGARDLQPVHDHHDFAGCREVGAGGLGVLLGCRREQVGQLRRFAVGQDP